jgi:zinc transporter 1/2/3
MEGEQEVKSSLLVYKLLFIVAIFGIAFLCGVLPAKMAALRGAGNSRLMGLANSFSGGLFLAIALVHILPECIHEYENMNHTEEEGEDHHNALPFLLTLAGYTFILFIDRVLIGGNHSNHIPALATSINQETPLMMQPLEIEDEHSSH